MEIGEAHGREYSGKEASARTVGTGEEPETVVSAEYPEFPFLNASLRFMLTTFTPL